MHEGLIRKFLAAWLRKYPQYRSHREDLLQELRIVVIRAPEKYDPARGKISTYLMLMFRRALMDWRRWQGEIVSRSIRADGTLRGVPTSQLPEECDPAAREVCLDESEALLSVLPERERYVLTEVVLYGRTQSELAAELGISKNRAHQIYHRALQRISRFFS